MDKKERQKLLFEKARLQNTFKTLKRNYEREVALVKKRIEEIQKELANN